MNYIISIISAVVMLGTFGVLLWRVLENSGAKIPQKIGSYNQNETPATASESLKVFAGAFLFRVIVLIICAVIFCLLLKYDDKTFDIKKFFDIFVKWDANNYIRISNGYGSHIENGKFTTLVFYPLYPFFLSIVNNLIPNIKVAGILLSSVLYSAACSVFYMLMRLDYKRSVAEKGVVLMSVFPFAFYYGTIMSESIFLLTSVLTLYYIRKHNWAIAGFCGMLAALSRSAGVFLIIPATVEFVEEYNFFGLKFKDMMQILFKKWIWLLLMPFGICIYLYINYVVSGNAFEFLALEEEVWHQEGTFFFKTMGTLWNLVNSGYSLNTKLGAFLPELILAFAMMAILIVGLKKHRSMYTVWLLVYIIINTSISWPMSIARYLSCAVPAFMILADLIDDKEHVYTGTVVVSSMLFAIYLAGYILGRQIM